MVNSKTKSIVAVVMILIMSSVILIGCGYRRPTFKEKCVTTEDGFVYYLDDEIGLCIIELPDSEEVTIPVYIDGHRVMQLGYEEIGFMYSETHMVFSDKIKKLTIQHVFDFLKSNFVNLETVVFLDYANRLISHEKDIVRIGNLYDHITEVELKKGDKEINTEEFNATVIEIPECVIKIDEGVFDGLEGVTIKTVHESKPEGWEEGWNGNCEVIWGVELN